MEDNISPRLAILCFCALSWACASCGACSGGEGAPAPDAGGPVLAVEPGGPLEALASPAEVVAFGGSDAPARSARELGKALGRDIDLGAVLAERYGLEDERALDLEKPLRVAVVDPKKDGSAVVIVGVASREGLPARGAYRVKTRTVHLDFIGDRAVFFERPELMEKHGAFFAELAGATVSAQATLVVAVERAVTLYRSEIERLRGAGEALDQMARVTLSAGVAKDRLRLALAVEPKPASTLAAAIAGLSPQKLALLERLDGEAALVAALGVDPDRTPETVRRSLAAWVLQTAIGRGGEAPTEALDAFWKATSGQLGLSLSGGEAPALALLVGLRDAEAARKASRSARSAYAASEVRGALGSLGLALAFQPDAYRIAATPVDVVRVRPDGVGPELVLGSRSEIFVDLMSSHAAFEGALGVVALGSQARVALPRWMMRKETAELPAAIQQALGQPGLFALAHARPAVIRSILERKATASEDGSGAILTSSVDQGVLRLVAEAPVKELGVLAEALAVLRRGG